MNLGTHAAMEIDAAMAEVPASDTVTHRHRLILAALRTAFEAVKRAKLQSSDVAIIDELYAEIRSMQ
jgi:hypothetical protein